MITVLDKNFIAQEPAIEIYNSFIWTERYQEIGDCEIVCPATEDNLRLLKEDMYLTIPDSDRGMIIDEVEISTDIEEGAIMTVKGGSLEGLLGRRIAWGDITISGNLQNCLETLMNNNIIKPSDTKRKMENIRFVKSTDPSITSIFIDETSVTGMSLLSIFQTLCKLNNIGFKAEFDSNNTINVSLYKGVDRSYAQDVNPYVIFSPNYDNLSDSKYVMSKIGYYNSALVYGEKDTDNTHKQTEIGLHTGYERYETFIDASSISSKTDDKTLTYNEYIETLQQSAKYKLKSECSIIEAFDGTADFGTTFIYGVDFKMGDIVEIEDAYGHEATCTITEVIISDDQDGYCIYPTFNTYEEE